MNRSGLLYRSGLRGLGWGVLALVVAAVVLFAAVLVSRRTDGDAAVPPPRPALAGSWAFDEGAGTAAADGADRDAITLQPGAGWVPDGRSGGAVHFDGTAGYASSTRAVLDTAGSYTVSAWVRLDRRPTGFATAVSQDGDTNSAFYLQYVAVTGRWAMSTLDRASGGVRAQSLGVPEPGRWTHLAGVRDVAGGRLLLYVDGVEQGSVPYDLRPPTGGPLVVGRGRFGGQQVDFFPGAVDALRVFAGALTAAEVRALYDSGR